MTTSNLIELKFFPSVFRISMTGLSTTSVFCELGAMLRRGGFGDDAISRDEKFVFFLAAFEVISKDGHHLAPSEVGANNLPLKYLLPSCSKTTKMGC